MSVSVTQHTIHHYH